MTRRRLRAAMDLNLSRWLTNLEAGMMVSLPDAGFTANRADDRAIAAWIAEIKDEQRRRVQVKLTA